MAIQGSVFLGRIIMLKIPNGLLEAVAKNDGFLEDMGTQIGRLYTDFGLPIDMALDRLPYTYEQKITILHSALGWFVEHKRNSGATEKSIERQRKSNRELMERFIKSKEVGIY